MKTSSSVKYMAPGIEIFLYDLSDPMLVTSNFENAGSESFQDENKFEPIW